MHKIGITGVGSLIGQGIIKSIRNSPYKRDYKLIVLIISLIQLVLLVS